MHVNHYTGASIPPKAMMHFLLFQTSPYFRKIFRVLGKFSEFYLFRTVFSFYPPTSPSFLPISKKTSFPLQYFLKFPPVFVQFMCFFPNLRVSFFPPYFDHDALMHCAIH